MAFQFQQIPIGYDADADGWRYDFTFTLHDRTWNVPIIVPDSTSPSNRDIEAKSNFKAWVVQLAADISTF
jgi:hypothetical protein